MPRSTGVSFTANLITCIRIVCGVCLLFCPTFSIPFYIVYAIGGISDMLDGFVARRWSGATESGARLDTIADIIFMAAAAYKVIRAVSVPLWLAVWVICIAVIKCITIARGFIICKRFVSEHTIMNKICGIMLFIIPLCIGNLPQQAISALVIATGAAATFAAIHEGCLIHRSDKEK